MKNSKPRPPWFSHLELVSRRHSHHTVFCDFLTLFACSLACGTREEDYLEVARRYERKELDTFAAAAGELVMAMDEGIQLAEDGLPGFDQPPSARFEDHLGDVFCEWRSKSARDWGGEFYTPMNICRMMAKMMLHDEFKGGKPERIVTIGEPCAGSGRMILATAEEFFPNVDLMRVEMWDTSYEACMMSFINTTLYGIPALIIWGNTLSLEKRREFPNLHWFRVEEPQRRRLLRMADIIQGLMNQGREAKKPRVRQVDPKTNTYLLFE